MARRISPSQVKPKIETYSDSRQLRDFVRGQVFGTIPPVTASTISNPHIKDRTIIITGANSGLGLHAAEQAAELDCISRLILACRSIDKGNAAREAILSGLPGDRKGKIEIVVWQLDMASRASIGAFAQRASQELSRIDAIILNAGVDYGSNYAKAASEDGGFEMTLMVNVIGTIMLATLMVPVLRQKTATPLQAPRITITGSAVQFFCKYDALLDAKYNQDGQTIFEWLSDEKRWKNKITEERYFFSKGLVQMLVQQLAARISNSEQNGKGPVVLNCVAPGYCKTELFRQSATMASTFALKVIGRKGEVGARSLLVGALGKAGDADSHGKYMSEGKVTRCSSWLETSQGQGLGKDLWDEVMVYVKVDWPNAEQEL